MYTNFETFKYFIIYINYKLGGDNMAHSFNLESMKLDLMKKAHFSEFLAFKLKRDRQFRFSEFNKMTGISRQQWDVFRIDNKKAKKVQWLIE